jgi:nicotinate-nucleotide adenylyltransferase
MRLGLFGGTFDPVHYGHLRPVDAARVELRLPRLLILPNPQPPHKLREPLTPYEHRKAMLRLALEEFPLLEIADFEEKAIGPAYTTDTVKRVIASLPPEQHELWLIIGMDALIELPRWKDPETLFQNTKVAVLPRPGFPADQVLPHYLDRVRVLSTPMLEISATEIRQRLRHGDRVDDVLAKSVQEYIHQHSLYR